MSGITPPSLRGTGISANNYAQSFQDAFRAGAFGQAVGAGFPLLAGLLGFGGGVSLPQVGRAQLRPRGGMEAGMLSGLQRTLYDPASRRRAVDVASSGAMEQIGRQMGRRGLGTSSMASGAMSNALANIENQFAQSELQNKLALYSAVAQREGQRDQLAAQIEMQNIANQFAADRLAFEAASRGQSGMFGALGQLAGGLGAFYGMPTFLKGS